MLPKTILGRNEIVRGPNSNQYKPAILPTLTFLHLQIPLATLISLSTGVDNYFHRKFTPRLSKIFIIHP